MENQQRNIGKKKSIQKASGNSKPKIPKEQKGPSQSTILVKLAMEAIELFHDSLGNGYARILLNAGTVADHVEFHKLRSSSFQRWLRQQYLIAKETVPSATAVNDALQNLEGLAEFQGDLIEPRIRVGSHQYGTVWLDLGRDEWESVIVGEGEWTVLSDSSLSSLVKFHRPKGFLPLPVPEPGGDLRGLLGPFLNISSKDDFILIVSWLLGALMPEGPYPILAIHGEQGSAKSTTAKLLKKIIDPNVGEFRSHFKEERDLAITAANNWIICFDNMSWLSDWLSDAMCRVSTGGGFTTRTLYANREEEVFADRRPMILNGISDIITRHDLLDRCLFVTLPPIMNYKKEKVIEQEFALAHPKILGCLLTAVSMALKNRSKIDLISLPRMADFAAWVVAAEPALPWKPGAFLETYTRNRANVHRTAIEADLFASSLVDWFRDPDGNNSKEWIGKASELGGKVEDHHCDFDEKKVAALKKRKEWPGDGTRVSKKLRHLSGFLRRVRILVEFDRSGKTRHVRIKDLKNSVASVTSVIPKEQQAVPGDAANYSSFAHDDATENLASPKKSNDIGINDADDANDAGIEPLSGDNEENEEGLSF